MYSSNRVFVNAVSITALFSICQFAVATDAHQQMIVQSGNPFLNKIASNWQNYVAKPALAKWQELPTAYKWGLGITGGVAALVAAWKTGNSIRDYVDPVGASRQALASKDAGKMLKAISRVTSNDEKSAVIKNCWNQDLLNRVFDSHKAQLTADQKLHILFPNSNQLPQCLTHFPNTGQLPQNLLIYSTNDDIVNNLKASDMQTTDQIKWVLEHKSDDKLLCTEYIRRLTSSAHPFENPTEKGGKNGFVLMCEKLRPLNVLPEENGKYSETEALNVAFNNCFSHATYADYNHSTSKLAQRKADQKNCLQSQFPIFLNLSNNSIAQRNYFTLCQDYFSDQDWQEIIKAYHQSYENHPLFGLLQDNKPGLFPQNQEASSSVDQLNVDPTGASTSDTTQEPVADLNQLHAMQENIKTAIDTHSTMYFEATTGNIDWTTYLAFLSRTKYEHHDQKLSPIAYSFVKALNEEQEAVVGKLLIDKALKYNFLATSQQEKVLRYLAREAIESRCITYLQFIIENELYPSSDLPELEMLTAHYSEGRAYIQDRIKSIPHEKIFLSF